jgi:formylmethanofuran dehydrogenase subunit C
MTLQLDYRGQTNIPVEVDGLVPNLLRGLSIAQVERLQVFHGNEQLAVAELFRVTGNASDAQLVFAGNLAGVHRIGAGMTDGVLRIEGNCGRHAGAEMSGGRIDIAGNAADWLGTELHGGLIRVRGNAGNQAGGAYAGSQRGMTGGMILIDGCAGDEVGHSMRRGLLAVGGSCGDFVGINMLAGTILLFGDCGRRAGAGMRRGTIGLLGSGPVELLPTFRRGGRMEPLFLQLLFAELRRQDFAIPTNLPGSAYELVHGDLATAGRGEILLPAKSI